MSMNIVSKLMMASRMTPRCCRRLILLVLILVIIFPQCVPCGVCCFAAAAPISRPCENGHCQKVNKAKLILFALFFQTLRRRAEYRLHRFCGIRSLGLLRDATPVDSNQVLVKSQSGNILGLYHPADGFHLRYRRCGTSESRNRSVSLLIA